MSDSTDNLNDSDLPENTVPISSEMVKCFYLLMMNQVCILCLRLCLECNNSVFNDKNVFQSDGTAQGAHVSCSCSDNAMVHFDNRAENYTLKPTPWKRFRDDVFSLWIHNINTLPAFLDFPT